MVKKTKDDVPNPNSVSNRDIIQRLSFLYQASVYLNSIPVTSPTQPPPDAEAGPSTSVVSTSTSHARPRKRKRSFRKETTQNLSKCYVDSMNVVGKKTTVKMDPGIKRTICQGCSDILIPGSTTTVRVKKSSSHGHVMTYTCIGCGTSRRIPAPPRGTAEAPADVLSQTSRGSDIDMHLAQISSVGDSDPGKSSGVRRRKKNKGPPPRIPPLFARDAGHVVYCGNEKLSGDDPESGNGAYII